MRRVSAVAPRPGVREGRDPAAAGRLRDPDEGHGMAGQARGGADAPAGLPGRIGLQDLSFDAVPPARLEAELHSREFLVFFFSLLFFVFTNGLSLQVGKETLMLQQLLLLPRFFSLTGGERRVVAAGEKEKKKN